MREIFSFQSKTHEGRKTENQRFSAFLVQKESHTFLCIKNFNLSVRFSHIVLRNLMVKAWQLYRLCIFNLCKSEKLPKYKFIFAKSIEIFCKMGYKNYKEDMK